MKAEGPYLQKLSALDFAFSLVDPIMIIGHFFP